MSHNPNDRKLDIDRLSDFQNNATLETFQRIFGKHDGLHLWQKFVRLRHGILELYEQLDKWKRSTLLNYLSAPTNGELLSNATYEISEHFTAGDDFLDLSYEEMAQQEISGAIFNLDTGEVIPDITADTRVTPILHTQQNIDALEINVRAAIDRLANRGSEQHPFLRGYTRGAERAYMEVIAMLHGES